MYRIPNRRALLFLFSTFSHNYRRCAAVYARSRGLRLISTLSLSPRRPGVTQNPNFSIYTLRTFSLETATGRSEPKLESSSMETLNESNAAATTSADIEKSRASDDSAHDIITGSTDVEKSGDSSHDIITDVEKSGDSAHDIITDVEKSGDSSHDITAVGKSGDSAHDIITGSTDVEKSGDSAHDIITDVEKSGDSSHDIITDVEKSGDSSHDIITDVEKSGDSSHEVEGTCDSEVDPSLVSDERYAYLQKGFTTEIYKIEICNLPPFLGYQQIKKKLRELDLKPAKIKMPSKTYCFVTFKSDEDRSAALKVLNGYVWKKKTITAKVAAPAVDPLFKRKRKGKDFAESSSKRQRREEMSLEERLAEAVTPLLQLPYSKQLATKQSAVAEVLQKAAFAIQKKDFHPGEWFAAQVKENGGRMCPLEPIRPSPLQTGYRNKCEFSVGISPDNKPVVGFRVGSYEDGDLSVVSPDSCVHIPQKMKDFAQVFQQYFCKSSLPPLNPVTEKGHWRQVAVRCLRTGETTAVVQMHPQQLTQEEVEAEKRMLADYFSRGEGSQCCPTSLYFQRKTRTSEKPANELVLGEECIHETLLDMRFRISPDAFFQVNTHATEVVYSLVQELCTTEKPSVIYDICCGTGTIGLFLAKTLPVRRVIGVELVEEAVEDAKFNAQLNGITNTEFLCGKAEDVLPKHLERPPGGRGEVIGVVDPPRGGLHPHVVQVIRQCYAIERLIYVSCNPEGVITNFVNLCRRQSNRIKGIPFRPVKAIPVDLFPHTRHTELVVLFERVDPKILSEETHSGYK